MEKTKEVYEAEDSLISRFKRRPLNIIELTIKRDLNNLSWDTMRERMLVHYVLQMAEPT